MRARKIWFWIATALLLLELFAGGVADIMRTRMMAEGLARLGYPAYLMTLLGIWKILGGLAIAWPGVPRLKEWAYAGSFFLLTGAMFSHAVCREWANIFFPAMFAVLTLLSWALQPQRREGAIMKTAAAAGIAITEVIIVAFVTGTVSIWKSLAG
jgi:hypothetical protein